LLRGHEKCRHVGWSVTLQLGEFLQTQLVLVFLLQLHRQTIAQKRIVRLVGEHRFDSRSA